MNRIPPFLNKGDKIAIVATARKITVAEIAPALQLLEEWGLEPVLGSSIGLINNQFAGTDAERLSDFQQQLDNPDIKAVWCARGGYGTARFIDDIVFSKLKNSPKWVVGYSDVTALHSHLHNMGFATLHAQMAQGIEKKSEATRKSLKDALFGNLKDYNFSNLKIMRPGRTTGALIGGNLSMLYSLTGSASAIKTDGKILFIEDLDEYLYHIDRMMLNLKRNGLLHNLNGLIVGGMSDMNDNQIPFGKTAEEIIWEHVEAFDFPVVFNFPAGHIEDNLALVLGAETSLDASGENVKISFG